MKKTKAASRALRARSNRKRTTAAAHAGQRPDAESPASGATISTTYVIEAISSGWRTIIAHSTGTLFFEVDSPQVRRGQIYATLSVYREDALLHRDAISLTSERDRRAFLRAPRLLPLALDPAILLALEEAARRPPESEATGGGSEAPTTLSAMDGADTELEGQEVSTRPLGELLDAIVVLLTKYVLFRFPAQPIAVALWIAHTHVLDAFDVTPYLNIWSPEPRSGKTRLLELLEVLVRAAWRVVEVTAATVFRKIHRDAPVVLLDEADAIYKNKHSDTGEALRGVLDAGYRRGAVVPRCTGKNFEQLEDFEVFCAKALAGIGRLPGTVADRAVPIVLARRKAKTKRLPRFRFREVVREAAPHRQALTAWAASATTALREARPALPEPLDDRAAEIWEPLLAIADVAGGSWPEQARKAACALHNADMAAESAGVLLLRAIKEIFEGLVNLKLPVGERERKVDRISTVDLLVALVDRDAEPWGGWWGAEVERALEKKTTPRGPAGKLAALLRPFEVQPRSIRIDDSVFRGYVRADFEEAFERYVEEDAPGPDEAANPSFTPSPSPCEGRDNETTAGARGLGASRPASGVDEDATAGILGREGLSRCRELSSADGHGGEDGNRGTAAQGAGSREDSPHGEQPSPAEQCPKCSSKEWTPPLDGGPGHCGRCGPVTCLEREPGSNDVEDDVEVFE